MTVKKTRTAKPKADKVNPTPIVDVQSAGNGLGDGSVGDGLGDEHPFVKDPAQLEGDFRNEKAKPTLSIVIPYLKAKAQGEELKFALRSIETHFLCMNYNVVVIGDREDWFDDVLINHIDVPAISDNPQADVINKIKEALASELVADQFIWTNDDIYFVSPVEICDIETLKSNGLLVDNMGTGTYAINRKRTIDFLTNNNLPARSFATHMPVIFDKNKFLELFEIFPELHEDAYLIASVYFNYHYPNHLPAQADWKTDNWMLRLVSANPALNAFNKLVATKKFLNNSEPGYSAVLVDYLERTFGEPSIFEV